MINDANGRYEERRCPGLSLRTFTVNTPPAVGTINNWPLRLKKGE